MPPRSKVPPSIWNAGTIVNILAIPLLTAAIMFVGFYYTTRAELQQHTEELQKDNAARDKLREALLLNATETQKGLATLTATTMVQNEQIKGINSALERLLAGWQTVHPVGPGVGGGR